MTRSNVSFQWLPSSSSPSTSLAISPKGTLLYSSSPQGISVFDLPSLTQLSTFNSSSSGSIKALAFTSDGRHLFTAHQDTKIRVWKVDSAGKRHSLVASLPTGSDILRRFAFPRNYVSFRRHCKRLWIRHVDSVSALAVHNGLLFSVSWDKTLKIWDAKTLRCKQSISAHDDAVNALVVGFDGTVYTGSSDCRIRVWGKVGKTYALVASLEKHGSAINALVLSPDGKILCSGGSDGRILIWEEMILVGPILGHEQAVMCLAYEGEVLLSGSTDRTIRVWKRNAVEFSCLLVLTGHAGGVRTVAVRAELGEGSEEEYCVFSGSSNGEVRVWQELRRRIRKQLKNKVRAHLKRKF